MVEFISFKNFKMSKFYFLKTWEVGAIFTGDQTFLLTTSFFKIHGALYINKHGCQRTWNFWKPKKVREFCGTSKMSGNFVKFGSHGILT